MVEFFVGGLLILIGIITLVLPGTGLLPFVYPILWWGILIIIDAVNYRWRQVSLMRTCAKSFFGIILPLSTLYWLYFELVNFWFPQWKYIGIVQSIPGRTILTIFCFATVIPIIIEIFWLLGGLIKMPNPSDLQKKILKRFSNTFILLGLIAILLPFFSDYFWLNQLMWVGPFFIFLPFIIPKNKEADTNKIRLWKWLWLVALAGLISGVVWELLNFWAGGKWQYLIYPDMFRIFEMPILGYLGFIPFALSTIATYLFVMKFIKPRLWISASLYLLAIVASYLFAIALP